MILYDYDAKDAPPIEIVPSTSEEQVITLSVRQGGKETYVLEIHNFGGDFYLDISISRSEGITYLQGIKLMDPAILYPGTAASH